MAAEKAKVATLQDNIHKVDYGNVENYSFWLGGTDTTNAALKQYDLLRTGYGRIFILQMPKFIQYLLPDETNKFRHLLQFANTGIDGIQGYTVDFTSATVGYVGNTVELPINVKDDTSSVTIKIYETQGSLIRTYIDFWITGTIDPFTGFNHYHGARNVDNNGKFTASINGVDAGGFGTLSFEEETDNRSDLYLSQANHTMEMLYVATDPTGEQPEYVCLLTNMFPKGSDHSHFTYEAGSHDLVQLSLEFTAVKYMSSQINYIGNLALARFNILKNYLNMYSGYNKTKIAQRISVPTIKNWMMYDTHPYHAQNGSKTIKDYTNPTGAKNTEKGQILGWSI